MDRSAVTLCEKQGGTAVGVQHMALTIRQLLGTKRTKACASLPQTQQVVLCGIVQFCATEPDLMEQTLEKLHAFYQTFCKVTLLPYAEYSETLLLS